MNTLCQTFASAQKNKNGEEAMIKYLNYTFLYLGQL